MKSDIREFLRSHSLKEEDLDYMWEVVGLYPSGSLVKKLQDQGVSWRGLNVMALESLVEIYNKIYKEEIEEKLYGKDGN
jgi:hypothetical protein